MRCRLGWHHWREVAYSDYGVGWVSIWRCTRCKKSKMKRERY